MIFQRKFTRLAISLSVLLLAACAPRVPGVPVTGETPGSPDLPPQPVLDAQQWLAEQLSVVADQVQIIDVEQVEWTDSCLGLGQANESCLRAPTPGWRAIFEVNGQRYEVRTDETGSVIRLAPADGTPGASVTLENTLWNLISFGPSETDSPLVEGSSVMLMLAGGQAEGSGGCNSYSGTYQVEGNTISFDQIIQTERACADASMTEQEQRYFEALMSSSRYELDGSILRIWYGDETGVLVFAAVPTMPDSPAPATGTPGG